MNDLVIAAFELVENFGQREDGSLVNVVQQQDALAARLNTADGTSRNLAILDAGPVVRHEVRAPSHITVGREVLLDRLLAQQARYAKESDTACGSPMASRNDAKPSSISRAA